MTNQPANQPVAEVARRVMAAAPRLADVRLVVVDGPAGSGKTTYAAALSTALGGAPVVHMDDLFEGWTGLGGDLWHRLESQVLAPLRDGRAARYQAYDWAADAFAEWVEMPPHAALVVEGVGAAARPVDPSAVLRVWVEVPAELRLARGLARDGRAMRDRWVHWAEVEQAHFTRDGTRGRVDLLVDGTKPVSARGLGAG